MSRQVDLSTIIARYEGMSDDELVNIAMHDAHGLTPATLEIAKAEITKRGLNENMADALEAQNKTYTIEALDFYCGLIQKLRCPACGNASEDLNATIIGEVMSFIVFTHYKKKLVVACPGCLDKTNNSALTKSAIFGWWGLPWGIIRTAQAILLNLKGKETNRLAQPNNYLRRFALSKIGELETYKDDEQYLQQMIVRHHKS